MIRVKRTGDALGDHMMAAHFVRTLVDHGIEASYCADHYRDLVDVPVGALDGEDFYFDYTANGNPHVPTFDKTKTIFEIVSEKFRNQTMRPFYGTVMTPWVPVVFRETPGLKYDVVLVTKSGVWSRWRDWPGFPALKSALTSRGLTWIDASEQNVRNQDLLGLVARARAYVGIETGASHYVSMVARDKGVIIQSGYSWAGYWAPYRFKVLSHAVPCAPCFSHIKNGHRCGLAHACMTEIKPADIMGAIEEYLA